MLDLLVINLGNNTEIYQRVTSPLRAIEPPFWAGLIASFLRGHGHSVAILDADADNLSPSQTVDRVTDYGPSLIAVVVQGVNPSASSTPKMTAAIDLCHKLKEEYPYKVLVMGLHPSALPERTLIETGADFVCQGEGFYTLLELLDWLRFGKQGKIDIQGLHYLGESNNRAQLLPEIRLPPVAWDLLDMTKYRAHNWHCLDDIDNRQPYGVIYTSLGCPYSCTFCDIHAMYLGNKPSIRFRNPENVIRELDLIVQKYGVRHIKIIDELFTINERRVANICDLIIERNYDLNLWAYARVGRVTSPMLEKMKKAGINWLAYGFESASEIVRRGVRKGFHQNEIRQAIKMTKDAGINIMANFIFGLPDDDMESMRATLNMAKEHNFEYVNFYPCFAFPGSKLYDGAIRNNIALPDTWDGYAPLGPKSLPLPTKYLTSAQVLHFRDKAFQEYFSSPEYSEMVGKKFGNKAQAYIKRMLQGKLERKY